MGWGLPFVPLTVVALKPWLAAPVGPRRTLLHLWEGHGEEGVLPALQQSVWQGFLQPRQDFLQQGFLQPRPPAAMPPAVWATALPCQSLVSPIRRPQSHAAHGQSFGALSVPCGILSVVQRLVTSNNASSVPCTSSKWNSALSVRYGLSTSSTPPYSASSQSNSAWSVILTVLSQSFGTSSQSHGA